MKTLLALSCATLATLCMPGLSLAQGVIPPGCLSGPSNCYDGTLTTSGTASGQTYYRGYIGGFSSRTYFLFSSDVNYQTVLSGTMNAFGRAQINYTTMSCPTGTPTVTGTRICGRVVNIAVRVINVP